MKAGTASDPRSIAGGGGDVALHASEGAASCATRGAADSGSTSSSSSSSTGLTGFDGAAPPIAAPSKAE